jgi:meso-butanediol dehydrogenase/(S,S)-butanediol dehydrogenase/diacetyl reductase
MSEFNGKVVLVTGAASGIGEATARKFAELGANLVLADTNQEGLERVCGSLRERSTEACTVQFDARSREECRHLVDETIRTYNQLDVLCNIAGIAGSWRLETMSVEDWNRMREINLDSLFHITQHALPHLVKTRGNIVNMASASGKQGQPYNVCYCATKAGVIGFTRAIAAEFASRGVRANAVCPGSVRTPIYDNYTFPADAEMDLLPRMSALPGYGEASAAEIAAMVTYLASSDARFITGVDYSIDGGQLAL